MIRLFIIIGIVGVVGLGYMATYGQGPNYQMPPEETLLKRFEAEGVMPAANDVVENEEVEHGIFDVPPEDEVQLEMAMKNMGSMPGMNMPGMKMDGNAPKMKLNPDGTMMTNPDGSMVMEGDDKAPMKMDGAEPKTAMKMDGAEKPAMKMKLNPDGSMAVDADGNMIMEPAENAPMKMDGDTAMKEDEGGLKITEDGAFDREIELTMKEWTFSNLNIEVKAGERIRFNITNGGKIPHEFMFMTMPAMQAVTYRAKRADWNLLEHEALFEKSLVLPGGNFTFVAEVKENGSWMFMCMLPYHMQMGMMGQIATPGMAMDMKM